MDWGSLLRSARSGPFWQAFGRTLWVGGFLAASAITTAASAIGVAQWIKSKNAPGAKGAGMIEEIWNSIAWQTWGYVAPIIFAICVAGYAAFLVAQASAAKEATIRIQVPRAATFIFYGSGSSPAQGPTTEFHFDGVVLLDSVRVTNTSSTRTARLKAELVLLEDVRGRVSIDPDYLESMMRLRHEDYDGNSSLSEITVTPSSHEPCELEWTVRIHRTRPGDWPARREIDALIRVRDLLDRNAKAIEIPCPGEGNI